MEAQRTGGDEWRVEVDLDERGAQATRSASACTRSTSTPEAEDRLGDRVIVTRDGPKLFLYAASEEQAREAERVARDLAPPTTSAGRRR